MQNAPKILIVEDDKVQLNTMGFYLEKLGYKVRRVNNGVEAKQEMRQESFDLVITDFNMPYMDGLQLLQYAKSRQKNGMQAIVLSANANESVRSGAYESGAAEFIHKPFSLATLASKVEGLLTPYFAESMAY